jgi:hypothetical protein
VIVEVMEVAAQQALHEIPATGAILQDRLTAATREAGTKTVVPTVGIPKTRITVVVVQDNPVVTGTRKADVVLVTNNVPVEVLTIIPGAAGLMKKMKTQVLVLVQPEEAAGEAEAAVLPNHPGQKRKLRQARGVEIKSEV